jgi:hypothetical protein
MTLKNLVIATAAALSFAAVPIASANNAPDQLAELTPGGCYVGEPNGTVKQYAEWSWAEGSDQTQFGGGAIYNVTVNTSTNPDVDLEVEVEVEVTRLDPDLPMPTKMVYACPDLLSPSPDAEVAETGTCEARISDVEAAITEATEEELVEMWLLGMDEPFTIDFEKTELVGVFVKAMDPGVAKGPGGRQNYEKIDVCDVPAL